MWVPARSALVKRAGGEEQAEPAATAATPASAPVLQQVESVGPVGLAATAGPAVKDLPTPT